MDKIISWFKTLTKFQIALGVFSLLLISYLLIFVAPNLRKSAKVKLADGQKIQITATKEDVLGIFSDSHFVLTSDADLDAKTIKDNLSIEPNTDLEIEKVSNRIYNLIPKDTLTTNKVYKISLSTGEAELSWAFQTRLTFGLARTLPANKATFVPLNTGIELDFTHENFEDIAPYFSITPKVEGRLEVHRRTVSFVPKKLDPGTLYTVTLKKGLKLKGTDQSIDKDTIFSFETTKDNQSQVQDSFNLSYQTYEFSPKDTPALNLFAYNLESLPQASVKLYQYPSKDKFLAALQDIVEIPAWSYYYRQSHSISSSGLNKVAEFTAPITKQNYSGYFQFPQPLAKGFYLAEVNIGQTTRQALIQSTNISAYISVTGTDTLFWVNRVDDGQPANKASIRIGGKNLETDQSGLAKSSTPDELKSQLSLAEIIHNGDTLFLTSGGERSYYGSTWEQERHDRDSFWSYLYLDRLMYLPTDSVNLWGMIRDRDNLSRTQEVTITIEGSGFYDYFYQTNPLYQIKTNTTSLGTFIAKIPINSLNPGWYTVNAKVQDKVIISTGFSVQTYTKPAYQITLNTPRKAVFVGEQIPVTGKVSFFEGTPLSGLKLKASDSGKEINFQTDNGGNFSFNQTAPSSTYYSPQQQYINVSPLNPEEGDIQDSATVAVFDSSHFLRTKYQHQDNKVSVKVNLNNVDLSKYSNADYQETPAYLTTPVSSSSVSVSIVEGYYERVEVGTYYDFINKKTSPKYEYKEVKTNKDPITITTNQAGEASFEFTTDKTKHYELTLSNKDGQDRTTTKKLYLYGQSYQDMYSRNALRLDDSPTDSSGKYLIGESVELTPIYGDGPIQGKILYQSLQNGLKSYSVGDGGKYSFKFSESDVPNVMISPVLFTGSTYIEGESRQISFNTAAKKLKINVDLDKSSYQPADTAKLKISVKDSKGAPQQSEVNINMVDEAFYKIAPQEIDTLGSIYKSVGGNSLSTNFSHRAPLETNAAEGGGCFLPGTKILTPGNQSKNIEDISVGDKILTRKSTTDSRLVSAKVIATHKHQVSNYLVINGNLRVTPEHNLYINGRWMTAVEAKVGDYLLDFKNEYQRIFTIEKHDRKNVTVYNLTVDTQHTYIADGMYVHNEKGRDLFMDTAYFGSVNTGQDGQASLEIKLPDNLTSWRISTQGITSDLKAGSTNTPLPVKLPYFVDIKTNKVYLAGDKPTLVVRSFGESLKDSDSISYQIKSDTLKINKTVSAKGNESVTINLDPLIEGTHKITVSGKNGQLSDTLTRDFQVKSSYQTFSKTKYYLLSDSLSLESPSKSPVKILLSDDSSGKFYAGASNLAYESGDRMDQRLARSVGKRLLSEYFGEKLDSSEENINSYQSSNGGYSIYPYGSPSLEQSFAAACAGTDINGKSGLVGYLVEQVNKSKDSLSISQSLGALACLGEPVIVPIKSLLKEDITEEDKLYLAIGLAKIGDTTSSNQILDQIFQQSLQTEGDLSYLKIGKNQNDYYRHTLLALGAAGLSSHSQSLPLYRFVSENYSKEYYSGIFEAISLSKMIQNGSTSPVSFTYLLNGKSTAKNLSKGEAFQLTLTPEDLKNIKFQDIKGSVGLSLTYQDNVDPGQAGGSYKITRSYYVGSNKTNSFNQTDLVRVVLNLDSGLVSNQGCVTVTDFLPSGLVATTKIYNQGLDTSNLWYPFEVNLQRVSFCVPQGYKKPVSYYARVVSPGEFKADAPIAQSLFSPSIYSLGKADSVQIK